MRTSLPLLDFYATFQSVDAFGVQFGQFKVQGEYAMRLIKSPGKDDLYNHTVRLQGMFKF